MIEKSLWNAFLVSEAPVQVAVLEVLAVHVAVVVVLVVQVAVVVLVVQVAVAVLVVQAAVVVLVVSRMAQLPNFAW